MYQSDSLRKIPVNAVGARPAQRLHWGRRAFQIGVIVLALVIPISGLFRIDPTAGAFVVLGQQIWFSDFYLVMGLWMAVASSLVVTYSLLGTAFCGWACPQNTLSEFANKVTHRLLGKRADVELEGGPMRVSQGKNKWVNWVVLGLIFLGVAMAFAIIPLFYFYPPSAVWSFITFQHDPRLAGSLHWIYSIFVVIILLDVAFIRHFFCRFMCIYKVWQHSFKTQETLHIAYDPSALDECARCNYCVSSCFIGIDPRQTETYDACINCGECIVACDYIRNKRGTGNSLLRFELGSQEGSQGTDFRTNVGALVGRVKLAIPVALFGLGMFIWGIYSYQPYHLVAHQGQSMGGTEVPGYHVMVANKLYQPAQFDLSVKGLPEGSYEWSEPQVSLETAGRESVTLRVSSDLPKGIHPFLVNVKTQDGWQDSFRLRHYSAPKQEEDVLLPSRGMISHEQ